jgi:hypothetical protein
VPLTVPIDVSEVDVAMLIATAAATVTVVPLEFSAGGVDERDEVLPPFFVDFELPDARWLSACSFGVGDPDELAESSSGAPFALAVAELDEAEAPDAANVTIPAASTFRFVVA